MADLRYMLDTHVVSDLVRQPNGNVAGRVIALEQGAFGISIIVAAELRYGAARSGSSRLRQQLDAVLSAIETLPLDEPADQHYGMIRSEPRARRSSHRPQRSSDRSPHARALGATLVTNNTREFGRIPDLEVEDWR